MSNIRERAALVDKVAAAMGKKVYSGETPKNTTFRKDLQKVQSKVVTLEDAIRLSGLKDGMTISFHHHFRGGDKVVNMVVGKLAEMGFKNLHLAASSLSDVHAPLIDHIKNGVITKISTSGLRGELAKEISHGLMKEPVVFRSHGAAPSRKVTCTSTWRSSARLPVTLPATPAVTPAPSMPSPSADPSATPSRTRSMLTRW